jgi:DNA-directed RNA polymerase sigma subunit (sigma70/sigma32)
MKKGQPKNVFNDFDCFGDKKEEYIKNIKKLLSENTEKELELTSREYHILKLRLIEQLTFKEIGKKFGISESIVGQLKSKAWRKMINPYRFKWWRAEEVTMTIGKPGVTWKVKNI